MSNVSATVEREAGSELDALEALAGEQPDAEPDAPQAADTAPEAPEASEAAEADQSDQAAEARPTGSRSRTWVRRTAIGTAAALIVGLGGLSGYLGWQYHSVRVVQAAAEEARQAAEAYAVTLTSIDTRNLDENFDAVLDGATGEFRDIYQTSSAKLRQLLIDHQAAGRGVVLDSAIKSASKDEVQVLLFVDQTVSNTEVPDPRVDRSRIAMTMQRVDGRWKASEVELP
ncbi:hypothetical protein [Mycobacterium sp. 1274756.6]|uniref:hypothetical protein n=1 Tax=Mycobacterium sp. 1274756.6 TaxID=1834076 RepID=UPI001E3EC186|nr:hypothetical protein [Mycobacterium sp. 1274756.6]